MATMSGSSNLQPLLYLFIYCTSGDLFRGILHEGWAVTSIDKVIDETLDFGTVRVVHGVGGQANPALGCLLEE